MPAKQPRRGRARDRALKEGLLLDRQALRQWRIQRGFTQESLSQQRAEVDGASVGISYAQIRRIEKEGRAGPGTARILAALLGVELAQLRPRESRQTSCGLPREISVDFVGRRTELDVVLAALDRDDQPRIAVAVEGLPGIGKTELALQVCAHLERSRSFRILWFDAEQLDLTAQWSETMARPLGIEHSNQRERAQLAVRAIESFAEPTLVVLDNLERWSTSEPWPRPQGSHIRWLVTTRVSQLGGRAFQHIELPTLDAASSAELLTRIAGPTIAGREGIDELVEHLDGYTIAIELAAAFLGRFPEVSPVEYLKAITEGKADVLEDEVRSQTTYEKTLRDSLELLWQRIGSRARSAWQLAAFFAQHAASSELSDACGFDRRARAELRDFHLIRSDARGWSMHRLVREFGRRVAGFPGANAQAAFIRGCAARASALELQNATSLYVLESPHLELALERAQATDPIEEERIAELCLGVGEARAELGASEDALLLLDRAVAFFSLRVCTDDLERGALARARAHHRLARALMARGMVKLETKFLQRAADACRDAISAYPPGETSREWASAQRLLGRALQMLKLRGVSPTENLEGSIEAYRCALGVYTRDGAPMEWARIQRLLGNGLRDLGVSRGSPNLLRESIQALRACIEVFSDLAAPDLEIASVWSSLGNILSELCSQTGDARCGKEAIEACRAAIALRDREKMPLPWARAQWVLADALRTLNGVDGDATHLEASIEAFRASLEGFDRANAPLLWGMSADGLARTLQLLGTARRSLELLSEAARWFEAALERFVVDKESGYWAQTQGQLGESLAVQGEWKGDHKQIERGIALCRSALEGVLDHGQPDRTERALNLGAALMALGRCAASTTALQEARAVLLSAHDSLSGFTHRQRQIQEDLDAIASQMKRFA